MDNIAAATAAANSVGVEITELLPRTAAAPPCSSTQARALTWAGRPPSSMGELMQWCR